MNALVAPPRFTLDDAHLAADMWGANCGPGAIAAICQMTLHELRPHMGDFEQKRYTNPTLMFQVLRRLPIRFHETAPNQWPKYGLVRVQWEGPWTRPGVNPRAAYRYTHWVGAHRQDDGRVDIFDINAMSVGGWVTERVWSDQLVPWLLEQVAPRASGAWHRTHCIQVEPGR